MAKLVLLRHGESEWNKRNLFTGWVDVPLSAEGVKEAEKAGKEIASIPFDVIFTSNLIRAQMTLCHAMLQHESKKVPIFIHEERGKNWGRIWEEQTEKETIPVYVSWHLNERYYGRLQGLNKQQTKDQYGEEQVQLWRRSFSTPPPDGESLEMTAKRTLPFFEEKIMPFLEEGKNVLVSAHGNSLRSIVMKIEGLSQEEILLLEIPTGIPLSYFFRDRTFHREI